MRAIVVFDGDCGLCNGFVAWLIRHDRDGRFLIAGSAGAVGREIIRRAGLPADIGDSTIVLWRGAPGDGNHRGRSAGVLTRSDAVLSILGDLPLPWRLARAARIVPRSWRNRAYAAVASRRQRVAAEDPACGVPPAELVEAWQRRLASEQDIA
jgi:predicted DCC family thiol-disulfide oxidoreductase YuxK